MENINNIKDLYKKVYEAFAREYEIKTLMNVELEKIEFPSFDHTSHPAEHAYVMALREFFALNCRMINNPRSVQHRCLRFTLPTEPNATGSNALAQGFQKKVNAYLKDQVNEMVESMLYRAQSRREYAEMQESQRQIALARQQGQEIVEVWQ